MQCTDFGIILKNEKHLTPIKERLLSPDSTQTPFLLHFLNGKLDSNELKNHITRL